MNMYTLHDILNKCTDLINECCLLPKYIYIHLLGTYSTSQRRVGGWKAFVYYCVLLPRACMSGSV